MRVNRRLIGAGLVLLAIAVLAVLTVPITLTPRVRTALTDALSERYDSRVTIDTLSVSLLPRPRVRGEGVRFSHQGRTDVPPLVTVEAFSAEASIRGLFGGPVHLRRVTLEGLEINVPPGGMGEGGDTGDESDESPIVVDELQSERAVLRILRGRADEPARVFEIHELAMRDVGAHVPWAFSASLTNPTPPGRIDVEGTFGPWNAAEPVATPLAAEYRFEQADLGVFGGIQGVLASAGRFEGVLQRIEVDGRADVPAFALEAVGHPVPLRTRFHAIVDGTSGNTWLRPVEATLGRSGILAQGGVVEREGRDGRTVTLDVEMSEARIEDVLRLALDTPEPPMTGALTLETAFRLPPGDATGIERLELDGAFAIDEARFTEKVQARIDELSRKARGDDDGEDSGSDVGAGGGDSGDVVSNVTGRFVMQHGVVDFSDLSFEVPGARVELVGRFALESEALDFRGTVYLDADLADLTTGFKAFLARLFQPLFGRGEVTAVPITVGGTVDDPDLGLDMGRAFTPG